ncbi:MAG TPA: hypoxanthine-guanine phosphoribosyltransferase [Methylophilus sp.]|nr:hypoxanthine-guanine phosphoribosyltransferase [Methylophilus sp.]HQQ33349.1 hypoxanthine-guanine phosphoribosyltransferase [Methylophilus sp.]
MSSYKDDPLELLKRAELLYDEATVNAAVDVLCSTLNRDFSEQRPLVMCVMTGASYLLGQLLPKLKFPLEVGYVHATRYHGEIQGKTLNWKVRPEKVASRHVLIVDDILDEGVTLRSIVDECLDLGASSVKTAVLADKQLSILKPIKADYNALDVPDKYVFGCGMDVYGWWRNLPSIHALNDK